MSLTTTDLLDLRRSQLQHVREYMDGNDFRNFVPSAVRQAIYMGAESMQAEIAQLERIQKVEKTP